MIKIKTILFCLLVTLLAADKILVVLDNKQLLETHSQFFTLLKETGSENEVEFAFSFGKDNIELKYYDKFRYDHIVVMCTSEKCNFFVM